VPKEIILPSLSADFESGIISGWHVNVGDVVNVGDPLFDVETDKATVEVAAVDAGALAAILVPANSEAVPVGSVIGVLLLDGEAEADLELFKNQVGVADSAGESEAEGAALAAVDVASEAAATKPQSTDQQRIFASPLARRIAQQKGLDLSQIQGRGPNGRILKQDVEEATTTAVPKKDPVRGGYTEIPNSNMRKVIARRLGESKQNVPHFYLSIDCNLDALLLLRQDINAESGEGEGAYRVSVNDFVIKACALALRDVPAANASWTDDAILQYEDVDVAVAVATDGGLITPIVRNADSKGLIAISREVKELAEKARAGKLRPDEFQGGGFSISNLGMYGIREFSAIINPPQSCILAVGAGELRPVVIEGQVVPATVMSCTLSVDHRSVDGAIAAEFMRAYQSYIERPLKLLLSGE